jgi:hypothetical protein
MHRTMLRWSLKNTAISNNTDAITAEATTRADAITAEALARTTADGVQKTQPYFHHRCNNSRSYNQIAVITVL